MTTSEFVVAFVLGAASYDILKLIVRTVIAIILATHEHLNNNIKEKIKDVTDKAVNLESKL